MIKNILIKIFYLIISILISTYFVYKINGLRRDNYIVILVMALTIYIIIISIDNFRENKIENFTQNCRNTDWTNVGECSKSCGPGKQKQERIKVIDMAIDLTTEAFFFQDGSYNLQDIKLPMAIKNIFVDNQGYVHFISTDGNISVFDIIKKRWKLLGNCCVVDVTQIMYKGRRVDSRENYIGVLPNGKYIFNLTEVNTGIDYINKFPTADNPWTDSPNNSCCVISISELPNKNLIGVGTDNDLYSARRVREWKFSRVDHDDGRNHYDSWVKAQNPRPSNNVGLRTVRGFVDNKIIALGLDERLYYKNSLDSEWFGPFESGIKGIAIYGMWLPYSQMQLLIVKGSYIYSKLILKDNCKKEEREIDCKIKDCEIECNYGDWTNVGECDKQCGPGKQKQKRINIPKSWPELRLRDVNFFNNNKTKAFNFIKSGNTSDEGKAPEIRDTRQKVRSNYPDGYTWWRQGWGDPDFYVRVISEQGNTVTVRTVNTNELITWARKEQLDPYNLVFEVTGNDIWNLYNQQLSAYVLYFLNKYSANSGSTNVIGPNGNFNLSFNRNGNNVNLNFYNTSREIRDEGEYANAGKTEAICKPEEKTLDCKLKECPVNCSLTDWTNDGQCSKPCGPGKQKQVRTRNSARNGGDDSCSNELIREIDCKIQDCPPPVDCRVTDWRNEGNCSAPCGGGKQKQIRDRYPARDGGKDNCPTDLTREIDCNTQPCPKDCVIKNWKDTSTCSATCGGGVKSEQLEVIEPTGNGAPCPAIRTRQIRCNDKPCPVDCKYSANWEQLQWSKCDKTCGGGTQKKVRTIVTQAAYGGKACSEPLEITQQCNTQPCPIDCKVSNWTDWTQCSKFCGTGKRESTRTIITPAQFGGAACPTDLKKEENCNTMPCSDLDCVVSDWAETTCSAPCGPGTKTRTRTVIREPKPGGQGCPILREVVPCNNEPCPIDCKVSDWNTPPCPVKCGGSKIKRTRTILVPQAGRGAPCPPLEENIFCNTEPCAVDCVVSNWSEWSQCDKTCGGGVSKRTRTIVKPSQHKGAQCPILEESKPCNSQPCPVNCKVSEWDNWSKCTKECGGGTKTRTRTVVTKPQFGGDGCPNLIENDNCNTQPCPIDCKVGEWENWSDCTKECGTGTTTRKRQVLIEPKFGGKICPILEETKDCNTQNCPVDCKVSDWTEWAKCTKSCEGGVTSRSRKIIEPNAYGGKECPPIFESKKCNTFPCPINCEVSGWSRYSKCSKSCGGGTKVRTRTITQIPQFNGEKCPPLQDIQPCNTQPCPVDCQLSDWGPWTECSKECKGGFKSRSKVVMVKPQFDGEECPPMTETVPCNEDIPCVVDCKVSTWSPWSQCTKQCGTGTRTRTRNVITQPANDGEPCPKLTEIQKCNSQPCPVNCVVSAWSEFTKCSKQCGGGTQTRYRTIITPSAFGGKECPALTETISCNTNGCPVNCQVSDWGPFTDCSADCNGGIKKRKRKILVDPRNGGEPCPNLTESVPCNTHSCPIDCVVSQWGEWGDCSKECGPSERRRIRKVLVPPKGGGKPCPILSESKRCNTLPCPIDCEVSNWGEWSKCDKECGGGNQERRRRILIEPKLGGKDCPPLSQRRKCNTERC